MNRPHNGHGNQHTGRRADLLALLGLVLASCASLPAPEQCGTDTECESQCLEELRPDEDPAVCAISLAAVK